jgi:hypothetical protein
MDEPSFAGAFCTPAPFLELQPLSAQPEQLLSQFSAIFFPFR